MQNQDHYFHIKSRLKISRIAKMFLRNLALFLLIPTFFGCQKEKETTQENNAEMFLNQVEQTPLSDKGYLQLVDSLYNISKQLDYKKGIAKSFLLKGKYFSSLKQYDNALENFNEVVKVSQGSKELAELGDAFYNIGDVLSNLKKRDEALVALKKSATIRSELNDSSGLGYSYNFIGFTYWRISNFDSAVYYFEKSLKIRNNLPNKTNRATTYNNLGTVYYNWSLFDKALDHYLRSLELQKEQSSASGIARCLCNIGLVYTETAQIDKAVEYYRESIPYALASKIPTTIGYSYNCLGSAFSSLNKDSSLYYLTKSFDSYQVGDDVAGMTLALQGLGNYYYDAGQYSMAKTYYNQMLTLAINENIPMRIARAYKSLGQIDYAQNNLPQAQTYFEQSIVIGKKSSLKFILVDSYKYLSEIYEKNGKIDKALSALKQHNEYKLQIDNEGMQKRIMDLKNKAEYEKYQRSLQIQQYENEKQKIYLVVTIAAILFLLITAVILYRMNSKRKKINILLREKNLLIEGQSKELNQKNIELLDLNEAKEKLFYIIAHDLRSPFNTLINLGTLLKEDYHNLSDEVRLEYINGFEDTAIKTYELVENLLNLSASRTGRIDFNPGYIEVTQVINKVFNISISQANKKDIKLVNKIDKSVTAFADQSMLEIIVRNLVNNAIKYCKTGGQVEVSSHKDNHNLFIAVRDNGIGMDDNTMANIFNINVIRSKNGTGGEKGTGLGLGLCKEFVEKHGGSIWAESELDQGSKFIFSLPSEKPE
jgi:signal transduction histidine kinase/Tfp pilus assembly protein PilF